MSEEEHKQKRAELDAMRIQVGKEIVELRARLDRQEDIERLIKRKKGTLKSLKAQLSELSHKEKYVLCLSAQRSHFVLLANAHWIRLFDYPDRFVISVLDRDEANYQRGWYTARQQKLFEQQLDVNECLVEPLQRILPALDYEFSIHRVVYDANGKLDKHRTFAPLTGRNKNDE